MEVNIDATNTAAMGEFCGRGCMQRNISSHPLLELQILISYRMKIALLVCQSLSINSIVYRPYCQVAHVIVCCYAVKR
jgi:hypothetical protein